MYITFNRVTNNIPISSLGIVQLGVKLPELRGAAWLCREWTSGGQLGTVSRESGCSGSGTNTEMEMGRISDEAYMCQE